MKKRILRSLSLGLSLLCFLSINAQQLAFPGAVGFGAFATGGRGGTVYHVTNLNDAGTGSFRDAVSASNRIVVFDVGGYVNLSSAVSVKSNITIAGQTAPGDGIGIMGREVSFSNSTNVIVRYMRFRQGDFDPESSKSGINFNNSANMILDHVSIEFAQWNNIDAVGASNITFQYTISANPIGQQFAAHTETGPYTWYNCLFANSHNRCPLAKDNTQYINNVVYNFQAGYTAGNTAGLFSHDLIGNYFITGPRTTNNSNAIYQVNNQSFYMNGNYLDSNLDGSLNGSTLNAPSGTVTLTSPWSSTTNSIPAKTAAQAYTDVIAKVGASLHRDQVDALVIADVTSLGKSGNLWSSQTATGLANSGYGTLNGGTAPTDTDKDGMPDAWETSNGLNPNNASDANTVGFDGYTMIEKYVNSLVTPVQQYTLTTSISGSGSVSPNGGTYNSGTNVTVTATPASGWSFDSWSGAATGTANPATIVMSANKTLTAKFVQNATTYTLSTTVSGSGSVSPGSGSYNSGSNVTLTATPVTGWKFAGWSGSITSTSNPVTVTMDANKAIIATFTYESILEAENATFYQSVTETVNSGYSGVSYVNTNNVVGSYVEWTASIGVAGSYGIEVRNANGTTVDRPANILVNGTTIASAKSFPGTGAWTTWVLSSKISASLIAGSNKIRVIATAANGCANLDYLRITSSNLKSQAVEETQLSEIGGMENLKFRNFPNPFTNSTTIAFSLDELSHVNINIYNAQGSLVKSVVNNDYIAGYHEIEFTKGELTPGIYICKMIANGIVNTQKMIIQK